jgi:hypothetical protein
MDRRYQMNSDKLNANPSTESHSSNLTINKPTLTSFKLLPRFLVSFYWNHFSDPLIRSSPIPTQAWLSMD